MSTKHPIGSTDINRDQGPGGLRLPVMSQTRTDPKVNYEVITALLLLHPWGHGSKAMDGW